MTTQEGRAEQRRVWQERIGEQKQSGQTIRAFCEERGLSAAQFYYWRQRLRPAARPVRFALVEGGSDGLCGRAIEIELSTGERLRLAAEAATLRVVLGVLREARG